MAHSSRPPIPGSVHKLVRRQQIPRKQPNIDLQDTLTYRWWRKGVARIELLAAKWRVLVATAIFNSTLWVRDPRFGIYILLLVPAGHPRKLG